MATSKVSKQLQLKNLDQNTLDLLEVVKANIEGFKLTGIRAFLQTAARELSDFNDWYDD